MADTDANEKVK